MLRFSYVIGRCEVTMDAKIRIVSRDSLKKDKAVKNFPCIVKITGKHNHSTKAAEALGQLRVNSSTKNAFIKYFEQGNASACRNNRL